ncbi:LuxR C-terminal-related transcriptional regulator [Salipiger marinus]|jgi:DNA-binding NarL/FixJ family response regulator|uniref:Two component transcriptional regulator, LuxR family n=1 Tax=Salipiger marinus TaxID=555512 RepID=A0A1G8QQV2_9RHOB|nr:MULTISPECIES: response regulator transcription factor [Salipiger]MEB3419105.1 response regulator transcription factor [Salipiger manganoxidans]SDJ07066.1 two component transcriptional regulator, LuxR family [Salipiger marinus]HBM60361.1 DNA-binding response regulator [Citreicella sp.]HBT01948.1 DNA-binding response regulator [Citreicella sp.]|tara:strand:+ start:831 stop:1532 length:702 start_codon:yes stop_codon:yes gene_type:complete
MEVKNVGLRKAALISDDDEFFRLALSSLLTARLGFSDVIETETFDGAVDALSNRSDVEIALFDLNMPGMNNWQNLRTVRDCFPEVRVAVVSGSKARSDILMALSIGLHGYISKGLGVSELARALQAICDGAVYLPSFLPDLPITENEMFAPPEPETQPSEPMGALDDLTSRQREVLEMLVNGMSNKAIARALDLSEGTVKFHLSAVFRILRASNRVEAATSGSRLLGRTRAPG